MIINKSGKKNLIKKRLVMVIVILMSVCSLSSVSFAANVKGAVIPSKVTIDGVKYTTIKAKGGNLYPGKYALSTDVTLTKCLQVCNGAGSDEPTIIILNGHTLTGIKNSTEAAIKVSEGSKLIIKDKEGADGKVVAYYEAVSINDGSLTLENADIASCGYTGIDADNASIYIQGDSNLFSNGQLEGGIGAVKAKNTTIEISGGDIYENNLGICCGEGVVLSINGDVSISGNNTGIQLAEDTEISIGNGLEVLENETAGILCNNNQKIYITSEYDEDKLVDAEISILDESENLCDARIILPKKYKTYKASFKGCGGKALSVLVKDNAKTYLTVECVNCQGHDYTYTSSGNDINAHCSICGEDSKISLVTDSYYDSHSSSYFVDIDNVEEEIYIDKDGFDEYKVSVYPRIVYKDTKTNEYSFDVPSSYGTYTAKMVILNEDNNLNSILAETNEVTFSMMCSSHEWEYISDGGYIYAKCKNCEGILAEAKLSLEGYDLSAPEEELILYNCQDNKFESEITVAGNNMGLGTFAVIYGYYQKDGSLKYSFDAPSSDGEYTVKIAVLERSNNPNSVIASTDEISFIYKMHEWEYEVEGYSIAAHCYMCNDSCDVCLHDAELTSASRSFADTGIGSFEGNVFAENAWSSKEGIKKYHVLYKENGTDTYTSDRSILNASSFCIDAKIVLLENEDDINSVCYSTDEKIFYFATKPIDEVKIESFSEANMKKPKSGTDSGRTVYYVGTKEELYWTAKYAASNEIISLTNDIVVNPIRVSSDGLNIYSAVDTIYNWEGYGTNGNYFLGTIWGNGYTIYGLYSDTDNAGLISCGKDNVVLDITVKDSVFMGRYAAGIAAFVCGYNNNSETIFMNCNVINCCIKSSNEAGGIVGDFMFNIDTASLVIENCASNARIEADYAAGGIIGECFVMPGYNRQLTSCDFNAEITNCVNLGYIEADYAAGGILGLQIGVYDYTVRLESCRNAGKIESPCAAGGIVGQAHFDENHHEMHLYLYNCVSIGDIYCLGTGGGGLVGISDAHKNPFNADICSKSIASFDNAYYGANHAVGACYLYTGNDVYYITDNSTTGSCADIERAAKLTRELAKKVKLCNGYETDENGNVIKSQYEYSHVTGDWQVESNADCSHAAEQTIKCLICGETLVTGHSGALGHEYENGECIYCGEADENNIASVFSDPTYMVLILSAFISAACIIVVIYSRKKSKK